MSAEVTAKVKLDAAAFRSGIVNAQTGFTKFKNNAMTEGKAVARALAPAAKVLASIGVAAGAAAALTGVAFGSMVKDGLALNSSIEQATATFTAFTKDAALAKQIVMDLRTEADVTPFDTGEMITAGKALISSAKGSREELMKLVKTAEILGALNKEQGLSGAAVAIRNAMGGDFVSLSERFDISRITIRELKAQGLEGIELINAALKQMGAGPELVMGLANSWEGLNSTSQSFFNNMKQAATLPLFEVVKSELMDFVQYIGGDAKGGVDEFTKSFGENIADSAKDLFATIKSIDWVEMGGHAKTFADTIGTAASSAAALASSLPQTGNKFLNALDKTGLGAAKITGAGLDVLGMASFTESQRANVRDMKASLATDVADARGRIDGRAAEDQNRNKAFSEKSTGVARAPIQTNDVIKNWLKTRGKDEADLQKDKALQADFTKAFGQDTATGGTYGRQNEIGVTQAAKEVRAETGRAPLPVEITMTQQNPTHTVMAI